MSKVLLNIPEDLLKQVDETVKKWGFKSRAEFFRYSVIDFIRNDARLMPADDVLKDHTKAIRSVKVRIPLAEQTRAWNRCEIND